MDLSVFNLLMSTTPTVSGTETPFSGAAETNAAAQAVQMQESMKTGEAFLKVLEQVRAGKTEKSAETFFNTISAHADASSSFKNFKTNEKTGEEVKIVRLHIKRTRASEKLQKAEENTPAAAETPQNRQKIPGGENIADAQQTQTAVPQENTVRDNTDQTDAPITTAGSNQAGKPAQNDFAFSDELTAADILVGAALQANTVRPDTGQTQPADTAPAFVDGTEKQLQPDVRENTIPAQADHDTAKAPSSMLQPVQTEQNSVPVKQNIFLSQNKENLSLPIDVKANATIPVVQPDAPEQNNGFALTGKTELPENPTVSEATEETPRTAPAHEKQVLNERGTVPQETAAAAEFTTETEDFSDLPQKESRRQADQLAAGLPADVKIAVTVETNKPAAALFRPVSPTNEKNMTEKRTPAEKDQEPAWIMPSDSAASAEEETPRAAETKTVSNNPTRGQTEKQPAQSTTPQFTALPVEQKSFSSAVQTSAGTETTTGAVNTNTPAGQAFIPAGQELKGKAVSGTAALPKHVPVNELADQIKVNIKKALKAGLDKIDVVLKHKELGTIKVHLEIDKDGNMKAVLSTARTETLDLLRADLQGLKQALTDSGFNMNDEAFSFNYRGERYDDGGREQNERRHNGGTPSNEEEEIQSRPAPSAADYSGRYALNIRV